MWSIAQSPLMTSGDSPLYGGGGGRMPSVEFRGNAAGGASGEFGDDRIDDAAVALPASVKSTLLVDVTHEVHGIDSGMNFRDICFAFFTEIPPSIRSFDEGVFTRRRRGAVCITSHAPGRVTGPLRMHGAERSESVYRSQWRCTWGCFHIAQHAAYEDAPPRDHGTTSPSPISVSGTSCGGYETMIFSRLI